MKILFMGTPDIAAGVLKVLIESSHEIVATVTREDKPRGRGNVMTPTPVRILATENGIKSYTPKTLRDPEFTALLSELCPDIIVVVAYGKILPREVLSYPKYGCINLHVSLLPKYRGSAPMQRAIMNGERETGVTVMQMDEGLDTGDILLQEKFQIGERDNLETVHDKSMEIGAQLLLKALSEIENGSIIPEKQNDAISSYAQKVEKSELKIDFNFPAGAVSAKIRGLTPPGAYAFHNGKMLKLYDVMEIDACGMPGEVINTDARGGGYIDVACKSGALRVFSVVPEGKGKMTAGDFLRGRKIQKGDVLS
jgi:methionyl-tRNA formyltransferase